MNHYAVFDPKPHHNDYASRMFFQPMRSYANANGIRMEEITNLDHARNANVVILTDHLSEERIQKLKNNGCRISAFNVTDSSYFSNAIRYAPSIGLIDKIFMLSGLVHTNDSTDFVVEPDFTIKQVPAPFLPENEWVVYKQLFDANKMMSLPYVPWESIPDIPWTPFTQRSQKVLLRGGGHSRRIILAMFLMRIGRLDCNSGAVLFPYFADDMNPQFRFCDPCRAGYRKHQRALRNDDYSYGCTSPAKIHNGWDMSNLGHWNNRCPASFYWMADRFNEKYGGVDMNEMETLLNAKWITDRAHQEMLARIAFTSDLKWIHSIYMPQRFWQGASAGAINLLPRRTADQRYLPAMEPGVHYLTFNEDMDSDLSAKLSLAVGLEDMAQATKSLYDHWIRPGPYPINSNLLKAIFEQNQ